MPGTSGDFQRFFSGNYYRPWMAIDGNDIAFSATGPRINGNNVEGVYMESGGQLQVIADYRTANPDPTKQFLNFGKVDVSGGEVSFLGVATDFFSSGVYTTLGAPAGEIRTVFDQHSQLGNLADPLLMAQDSVVAMQGTDIMGFVVDDNFDQGFYVESNGQTRKLVDSFTTDPLSFDEFNEFIYSSSYDDGALAFQAYSPNNELLDIYLHRNGRNQSVIGQDDIINGKQLSEVLLVDKSLSSDSLLVHAKFTDGSEGIYKVAITQSQSETFPVFPTFDLLAVLGTEVQLYEGAARVDVQVPTTSPERRVIMDFSISNIPANATIESAVLQLDPSGSVGNPTVEVHGYVGDGVPSPADALATSTRIGTSNPVESIGTPVMIELDENFIQALLGTQSELGLVLSSIDDLWLLFAASDSLSEASPTLLLTVSYPESVSGDFNLDGQVNGLDFLAWQRGESSSPLSETDLLSWETSYGAAVHSVDTSQIPEPNSLILLTICCMVRQAACRKGLVLPRV